VFIWQTAAITDLIYIREKAIEIFLSNYPVKSSQKRSNCSILITEEFPTLTNPDEPAIPR
jgi:hypothetical protein